MGESVCEVKDRTGPGLTCGLWNRFNLPRVKTRPDWVQRNNDPTSVSVAGPSAPGLEGCRVS